jgi:hypothetical protein
MLQKGKQTRNGPPENIVNERLLVRNAIACSPSSTMFATAAVNTIVTPQEAESLFDAEVEATRVTWQIAPPLLSGGQLCRSTEAPFCVCLMHWAAGGSSGNLMRTFPVHVTNAIQGCGAHAPRSRGPRQCGRPTVTFRAQALPAAFRLARSRLA